MKLVDCQAVCSKGWDNEKSPPETGSPVLKVTKREVERRLTGVIIHWTERKKESSGYKFFVNKCSHLVAEHIL